METAPRRTLDTPCGLCRHGKPAPSGVHGRWRADLGDQQGVTTQNGQDSTLWYRPRTWSGRLPVQNELALPRWLQLIDFADSATDPNRLCFNWESDPSSG